MNFGIIHIQNWLQIPLYTKCLIKTWLSFLDPSKIDQVPSNKTMVESNNITLHCHATGNPAPNITWTKDGKQTVLHHGEEYTITNISRNQHGSYKCAAWNNVGQVAKSSFSINVLCKQVQLHTCTCIMINTIYIKILSNFHLCPHVHSHVLVQAPWFIGYLANSGDIS